MKSYYVCLDLLFLGMCRMQTFIKGSNSMPCSATDAFKGLRHGWL
jgi:hypothetical protein